MKDEIEEACRLLAPFAALSQPHQDRHPDDWPLFAVNGSIVTMGDIRAAARFVAAHQTTGDSHV